MDRQKIYELLEAGLFGDGLIAVDKFISDLEKSNKTLADNLETSIMTGGEEVENSNKLSITIDSLTKDKKMLIEHLEKAIYQSVRCPICRMWDHRELGHESTCFMRTIKEN